MDNIPSANMRQHKLDQQRRLIEEKQRQKRWEEGESLQQKPFNAAPEWKFIFNLFQGGPE